MMTQGGSIWSQSCTIIYCLSWDAQYTGQQESTALYKLLTAWTLYEQMAEPCSVGQFQQFLHEMHMQMPTLRAQGLLVTIWRSHVYLAEHMSQGSM